MAGHKTFSLMLWKQAVAILEKAPRASVGRIADALDCTHSVASYIKTDYRKMKKKLAKQPQTFNKIS